MQGKELIETEVMIGSVKYPVVSLPATHSERESRTKRIVTFVLVCLLSFAAKVALSFTTYGSNDVLFWEANLRKIQADGGLALYRDGAVPSLGGKQYRAEHFNQLPFMIHVLRAWGTASTVSGVPVRVWLRMSGALADIGMLWLVWAILKAEGLPVRPPMLLLLALSPVSILVSGFHGNTDPIMVFFTLLSIYLIDSGRFGWVAGAMLGMAMNIKVVPAIFLPAILLYLTTSRQRIEFTLSAAVVFLAGSTPYLMQDPMLVIHSVFGYRPVSGSWGLSQIACLISGESLTMYRIIGKPAAVCTVFLVSTWIHIRAPRTSLFLRCGFLSFLFLFVISGFGPQYLSWIVPWWVVLPWKSVRWHYIASAAYVVGFYAVWSRGGWYIANMLEHASVRAGILPLSLCAIACWISVGTVALAYRRHLKTASIESALTS